MLRLVAKRYQTCLSVVRYLIKCLTSFKFYQTRSSTIRQDIQSGNCSVTKRCLIVFARQTFPVWLGLKRDEYFTKLSKNPFTCNTNFQDQTDKQKPVLVDLVATCINYSWHYAQCDWRDSVQMAPLFQCPSFLLIKHSTVYKLRLQHIWYTVYFTTVPVAFEINGVDCRPRKRRSVWHSGEFEMPDGKWLKKQGQIRGGWRWGWVRNNREFEEPYSSQRSPYVVIPKYSIQTYKQFFTKPRSFITDSLSVVWTI